MLEIYKLIMRMQEEIGNGASVSASVEDGVLVLVVVWLEKEWRGKYRFSVTDLEATESEIPIGFFVSWCKRQYERKEKTARNLRHWKVKHEQ